jgi:gamma-glutamylcyclotransferase (GGCT)/AIG2-like uncharacterized protein YtfP
MPSGSAAPVRVFVYGTLMPGRLRWAIIRDAVRRGAPAQVAGALYDTGRGYPAACFDEPGAVPGWVLELDPPTAAETLDLLDRIEGPEYRRVAVVTTEGEPAESFTWIGPRADLVPLTMWSVGTADER